MLDLDAKFNTVCGDKLIIITKCKLLFANLHCRIRTVDLFCDDVLADLPFRLIRCDRLSLFDTRLLPILRFADSGADVQSVIAYSYDGGVCRFICSGDYSAASYSAPILALFYKNKIAPGQTVSVSSPYAWTSATVTDDGVVLFD